MSRAFTPDDLPDEICAPPPLPSPLASVAEPEPEPRMVYICVDWSKCDTWREARMAEGLPVPMLLDMESLHSRDLLVQKEPYDVPDGVDYYTYG